MAKKIVLAEDEPQIARLIEFKLKKEGYQVTWKENGEKALKAIKADKQALILKEVMMPVMDGYIVSTRLKDDETLRSMPEVMLRASALERNVGKEFK